MKRFGKGSFLLNGLRERVFVGRAVEPNLLCGFQTAYSDVAIDSRFDLLVPPGAAPVITCDRGLSYRTSNPSLLFRVSPVPESPN